MARKLTLQEAEEIAEVWYQRMHRLREYWIDERNPALRRARAYGLWRVMVHRMLRIGNAIANSSMPKFYVGEFKPGGVSAKK